MLIVIQGSRQKAMPREESYCPPPPSDPHELQSSIQYPQVSSWGARNRRRRSVG